MIDQMNFSREFNTLYMASSPRAKFQTLSQLLILYISICFPVLVSQLKREYFILSNQQTGSTDQLEHSAFPFCKQGEGFQPRLQFPPLFCIILSANQVLTSRIINCTAQIIAQAYKTKRIPGAQGTSGICIRNTIESMDLDVLKSLM